MNDRLKAFGKYAALSLGALVFFPAAALWVGGFLFGEGITRYIPNWFGLWFIGSLVAMCAFLAISDLFAVLGLQKDERGSIGAVLWWSACAIFFAWILYHNL